MEKVTAIFDIGKTNKKLFLFDRRYRVIDQCSIFIEEIEDEDGFPCDDLDRITDWMLDQWQRLLEADQYQVRRVNVSAYGASWVLLDSQGNPTAPLYNYLKPLPEDIIERFEKAYGSLDQLALETASPPAGMLNSGLQLYWLKYTHPEVWARTSRALHLPQYLSYLLSGVPVSEPTSIGCHTVLWDYQKNDYHEWVYSEGLDRLFPATVPTHTCLQKRAGGKHRKVGIGIHDSSAALYPYLHAQQQPFVLLSTGTWNVCLNPFYEGTYTREDLAQQNLFYRTPEGKPVKASRLFLGYEHDLQVKHLCKVFGRDPSIALDIAYDVATFYQLREQGRTRFHFRFNDTSRPFAPPELEGIATFDIAYHQLMLELVEHQSQAIRFAIGDTEVSAIYIDGGFANNDLFAHMIKYKFPAHKVRSTRAKNGSALGAAMIMQTKPFKSKFLRKYFGMKKVKLKTI